MRDGGPDMRNPEAIDSTWWARHGGLQELAWDRDPHGGARFPTVLAMRTAKLRKWMRAAGTAAAPNAHHVQCREFLLDPRFGASRG